MVRPTTGGRMMQNGQMVVTNGSNGQQMVQTNGVNQNGAYPVMQNGVRAGFAKTQAQKGEKKNIFFIVLERYKKSIRAFACCFVHTFFFLNFLILKLKT